MEVTLVHPDDKDAKIVATSPIQVAAFRGQGFVEESELSATAAPAGAPEGLPADQGMAEEVARLKAENKALKSENTRLKNKLSKSEDNTETVTNPEDEQSEGDEKEETE